MDPGSSNELSAHDRLVLDLEKTSASHTDRECLCERIDLPIAPYSEVLEGLIDTDAVCIYAPQVTGGVVATLSFQRSRTALIGKIQSLPSPRRSCDRLRARALQCCACRDLRVGGVISYRTCHGGGSIA